LEATTALATVEEGISWLGDHQEEGKEVYAEKQKEYTDKIQPTMMKLYQDAAADFKAGGGGATQEEARGPKIEEVD